MNNNNGAALLARVKAGDLVTVRSFTDGRLIMGRARPFADTLSFVLDTGNRRGLGINAHNIVRVQPCERNL